MMRCGSVGARVAAGGGPLAFLGTHADLFSTGNVSSLESASWAVSGSNRLLLAFAASGAGTPADSSAVKWGGSGGTALTKQGSTLAVGPYGKISLYSLVAPTAQTSTSYYQWLSAQDETAAGTLAFTGANQSAPLGTVATASGIGTTTLSPSVAVASAVGDLVVAACWMVDASSNNRAITSNGGTTLYDADVGTYEFLIVQSKVATTTTTTVTFDISGGAGGGGGAGDVSWGLIGVAVKP